MTTPGTKAELFRMMAHEENVSLLTTFDRDSARLFPDLANKTAPPEKARVLSAFGSFRARRQRPLRRKADPGRSGDPVAAEADVAARDRLTRCFYDVLCEPVNAVTTPSPTNTEPET